MSEFRRAKRRKVEHRIEVFDTMTERVIGHLGDLSESGMLLVLTHPLVSDALYQLRFALTDSHGIDHSLDIGAHELRMMVHFGAIFGDDNRPALRLNRWANVQSIT